MYYDFNNPFLKVYHGIQWFLFKKGLLAHSHLELGGFIKSSEEFEHPSNITDLSSYPLQLPYFFIAMIRLNIMRVLK